MQALIFDMDGTLIDSAYTHALAWQRALAEFGIDVPVWETHRRIGMSGRQLVKGISRQHGRPVSDAHIDDLDARQGALFRQIEPSIALLPGARELIAFLQEQKIAHGIATTGKRRDIESSLKLLGLNDAAPVVDGGAVERAKPEPDLFTECQRRLGVAPAQCLVVGDSVWDVHAARRAGLLAVGLLCGGTGEQELYNAGAMRVYADPATLHRGLDELGFGR